jgi:hypothetical protein
MLTSLLSATITLKAGTGQSIVIKRTRLALFLFLALFRFPGCPYYIMCRHAQFNLVNGCRCHNSSDPLGGCNGLSSIESETMMSFWAMFASPMLMSNDLRSIQPWAKDILLNKEVCEVLFTLAPWLTGTACFRDLPQLSAHHL